VFSSLGPRKAFAELNGKLAHGSGPLHRWPPAQAGILDREKAAVKARLSFGDQLRLEAPSAIARHRNLDLAILGQKRLELAPLRLLPVPRPAGSPFS
jgi:hypothetical protein